MRVPVTCTASERAPISSLASSVAGWPAVTVTWLVFAAKPESSKETSQTPGGRLSIVYRPFASVTVVRVVAPILAVTVAPGSIAPVASATVPVIRPVLWAAAASGRQSTRSPTNNNRHTRLPRTI